jgi:hypothetical protein
MAILALSFETVRMAAENSLGSMEINMLPA